MGGVVLRPNADSMATRLECLSAGYIHESVQCEKERQTELMTKNGAVKLEFHAIETEMLKLADIIHIEQKRQNRCGSCPAAPGTRSREPKRSSILSQARCCRG